MPTSEWVVAVTDDTFAAEVAERSRTVPIVVDFWAPWCGPCRALAPLLEGLAAEKAGGFVLAKVNTDENPGLAEQFAADGIPAVYAVKSGQVVDSFVGLLPEADLRAFVDRLLPTATESAADSAFTLEGRDPAAAEAAYRRVMADDATNEASRVGLARVLLTTQGREAEAIELLSGIELGDHADEAERLRTLAALREPPHSEAELTAARAAVGANAEDAEARFRLGEVLAARGDYLPALDVLLSAAELDRALAHAKVKELMVKVFRVIGNRSPEADDYRGRLRSVLY